MNTNPLEKQLESWVPRPPSARLKQRIFGAQVETRTQTRVHEREHAGIPAWVKFASACCCVPMLLLFMNTGHRQKSGYLAVVGGSNAMASLSSNLLALCATDISAEPQNVWKTVTFDWTKDGHSLSTNPSFHIGNTNIQKL